jgi:histidinol-phosphate aminotransferase
MLAGTAAIQDIKFQEKSFQHNKKWMQWLENEFRLLRLDFQTSITNFLLVKFPDTNNHNATNAEKFLADRGILVRGMKVYGLPNHLRISIGNEKENIVLIRELKSFLENGHEF